MAAHRLLVLPTGTCRLSASRLRRGGSDNEEMAIPMPIFAIDTDDGWVVFARDATTSHDRRRGRVGKPARVFHIDMKDEYTQLARLKSIGLTPDRVNHVVVSHLHMNHAGGMQFFPALRIWLQKTELRWAMFPSRVGAADFVRSDFDRSELRFVLIEGDSEIVPGVFSDPADGHMPATSHSSSICPRAGSSSAATARTSTPRSRKGVPPPVAIDDVAAARSLARVRGFVARDHATLIVNHDAEDWKSIRIAPEAEYT